MLLPRSLFWLSVLVLTCAPTLGSAGEAEQRAELALLERQLEGLERQAERGAALAAAGYASNGSRYHFDFTRLRNDIQRVRGSVRDYLTPPRAQPRDSVELRGEYRADRPDQEAP
ncbi:hypothetical protein SMQE13_11600 [Serratia marcescens]|nr:hypothetical protein SMQE13_11600 [Serratia marcescens]